MITTVKDILQNMLDILRAEGWSANGYRLTPPWSLRAACQLACNHAYRVGHLRDEAYRKTIAALAQTIYGKPVLGSVSSWETDERRKWEDIEKLLLQALEVA
jgi:hypothetical protein